MDWQSVPDASTSPTVAAHLTALPFDVFLELVKKLDVLDIIYLRLVRETSSFLFWTTARTDYSLYHFSIGLQGIV